MAMSKTVRRLFDQFKPENYQLNLKPDREAMTFAGNVIITGQKAGRPNQRLTFHQKNLKILAATITRYDHKGEQQFEVVRINIHKSFDEVRLHSKQMLYPGNYTIELKFEGKITRPMNGIYPCFFKDGDKDKLLIATQFESHHAREAFPCIDEPEAKATFDLTLTTPKGEAVIANTPIKKQVHKGNLATTTFETTPRMSTYLLAFVYGEVHGIGGKTKAGVEVRSWATIAQPKKHLQYANYEAIAVLDFLTDYFGVPFPLPKIDQVALPDFDSLAMENWGLITFREVGLLADPVNRSISGEQLITQIVSHELSHQWFGNLVTMKWWDDLWLNESLATIMESLVPDRLHPEWHEWEDFTSDRVLGAANRDVYKDVQPVGVRVKHPDEILSLFDPSIVYAKGARILKMLLDYIGEDNFRQGLRSYFIKYAYKNTEREDLWRELTTTSGVDISGLMTPWIEQSGTPMLSVKEGQANFSLSQERFLLDGEDATALWPIPLLADTKVTPSIMSTNVLTVESADKTKNVIFNPTGSGHFITHYEDKNAKENVRRGITGQTLEPSGRIIAINDMLLQAQKGTESLTAILELMRACAKEERDGVWSVFMRVIGSTQRLVDDDKQIENELKKYKRELASYWYEKLGWEDQKDDDINTKHLRTTAIALSIAGEDKTAIAIALDKFIKAKTVENLPAEQRAIIAGAVIRFGKSSYTQQLMREYLANNNPDVQSSITAALCSTRDTKVAREIVKWGMENFKVIRQQDIDRWFAYLLSNYYTREVAWQWLTDNWGRLTKAFGEGKKMEYFIWYAARPIATKEWQKRFVEFFEPMLADISLKRNILISFSEIQARVDWRERDFADIKKFFSSLN